MESVKTKKATKMVAYKQLQERFVSMVRWSIYRCRASNTLIIRHKYNAGTEFEPLLGTVVLLLQITESQCDMPNFHICFLLFSRPTFQYRACNTLTISVYSV